MFFVRMYKHGVANFWYNAAANGLVLHVAPSGMTVIFR